MNMTEIAQLITQLVGGVGFPIVACIALFWQNDKWETRHEEETKAFSEAIASNTKAIENLTILIKEKME